MQFFSWRRPFQTKLLFFQTIESAKCAFATRAGSGKPAFLHALFLENERQNGRKHYRAMFSHYVQGHMETCKNLAHLEAKKDLPKKSLMLLMQAPFQL